MEREAEITELRLGPSPGPLEGGGCKNKKRVFSELEADESSSCTTDRSVRGPSAEGSVVVGWPPVCSYRQRKASPPGKKTCVKVSMDGVPILRKVDLHACKGYADLTAMIEGLFGIRRSSWNGSDGSQHTQVYEDKEGDWMLVGDVPWDMFLETCRRLRIMKNSSDSRIM